MKERPSWDAGCTAYGLIAKVPRQEATFVLYVAIDQHCKQLTANVREESGRVILRKQVRTRGESPKELLMANFQEA